MSDDDTFSGLKFLVQYRRKDDGVRWHNMAAFDANGPAEKYFAKQGGEDWPWEYRLVDLEAVSDTSTDQKSDFEQVFQDACDEAGCEYDNEALLSSIANLTSYPDMLWEWFRERRGNEDMRANAAEGGLSAYDFKQMLDEHEASLLDALAAPALSDSSTNGAACLGDNAPCDHFKCTGNQCLDCEEAAKRYEASLSNTSTVGNSK